MSAYTIKLTNGHDLVTIQDGLADTTHSSITLFGKNFSGYGLLLNENQVKMLENFSLATPPHSPIKGQLWWDSQTNTLKIYRDYWKNVSGPTSSPTPPVSDTAGDLWWDSANQQLKTYTGAEWMTIGPSYTTNQGVSGTVTNVINDSNGYQHTIVEFYVNGELVGVLSKDSVFPIDTIPGIASIRPGFNLISGTFIGDAENSKKLGDVLAENYLRSDIESTTLQKFNVKTNDGLQVGLNDDLKVNVSGSAINFSSTHLGRDINFVVNASGSSVLALNINGTTGKLTVPQPPTASTDAVNKQYVDDAVGLMNTEFLHADGSTPVAGNLTVAANNVYALGTNDNRFSHVYTTNAVSTNISSTTGLFNKLNMSGPVDVANSVTTKAYVDSADQTLSTQITTINQQTITQIVDNAPTVLNTLRKISTALDDNPNYANDVATSLAVLATIDSPTFTGTPEAPTVTNNSDSTNKVATTKFVQTIAGIMADDLTLALDSYAKLDSPVFTGTPVATNFSIGHLTVQTINGDAADLAENYVADAYYEPGTVLDFGGEKEVTLSTGKNPTRVAGVVSTEPAYLMNSNCNGEFVVALALQGRVPVKVVGYIQKGDILVSNGDGTAKRTLDPKPGTIIGKALEQHTGEVSLIEVAIGRC